MKLFNVLTSVGLPVAAAVIGTRATKPGTQSRWYRKLDKPCFQPPPVVFPIAWTALYLSIGAASLIAQEQMDEEEAAAYRLKLAGNMTLNAGWSWSFFGAHRAGASVPVAAALAASSTDLAVTAGKASPVARGLLVPYALWTWFATVLNFSIWRLNRKR